MHSKTLILIASLALFVSSLMGQNYIGLHKDEIKEKVKEELSGFSFTNEIFNYDRSFIKFENQFEEQTLIFMLNSEGYCTSVSRMYNTWLFGRLRNELDQKYGKSKSLKWDDTKNNETFEIELRRGQWFVTVITRRKSP